MAKHKQDPCIVKTLIDVHNLCVANHKQDPLNTFAQKNRLLNTEDIAKIKLMEGLQMMTYNVATNVVRGEMIPTILQHAGESLLFWKAQMPGNRMSP